MFTIEFHPRAVKEFARLSRKEQERIRGRIESLRDNPRQRGVVKLAGWESYRLRSGSIRIIFKILDDQLLVLILKIGHRGDVYK